MATLSGDMTSLQKWKVTQTPLPKRDVNSGRRNSPLSLSPHITWLLSPTRLHIPLTPLGFLTGGKKEIVITALWREGIMIEGIKEKDHFQTEDRQRRLAFLVPGTDSMVVIMAVDTREGIGLVVDKGIALVELVAGLRSGSMTCLMRPTEVQVQRMRKILLLRWKLYWLLRTVGMP
uniref:Uncharacterized protein n=1 Tax=Opuntia streptacantha TaxID=393608 RepID=A0A7C9AU42_OPUST